MRAAVIAAAGLAVFSLGGCGSDQENADPRKGVVYIEKQNCLFGGCFNVSKVCLGPDLIWRDTRLSEANHEKVIEDSPECAA